MVTALVILDGLRPDAVPLVATPRLDAFRAAGSFSLDAQSVWPSLTLPSHLSMLTSVPPQVHGVLDNDWNESGRVHANLVDQIASAGMKSVAFYSWEQLRNLWAPGSMTEIWFRNSNYLPDGDPPIADAVQQYFGRADADFAFIYFGSIDTVGHIHGWMSDEYLSQIETVDAIFGVVSDALGSDATVLMQADHGGRDSRHGSDHPDDLTIPWMIAGPGIVPNNEIGGPVSVLDTAPTLAKVLGLNAPRSWQGAPVPEAFVN